MEGAILFTSAEKVSWDELSHLDTLKNFKTNKPMYRIIGFFTCTIMIRSTLLTLLSALLLLVSSPAISQNRKFTIAEATNGLSSTLAPATLYQPSWQPGTHNFYQVVKNKNTGDQWLRTEVPSMKQDSISLKAFNNFLFKKDSLKSFPALTWRNKEEIYFQYKNNLFFMPTNLMTDVEPQVRALPEEAQNVLVNKNNRSIAYTLKNNIGLIWEDGSQLQVTNDADENIVNGIGVHRNEFGIDGGLFFSPKGSALAYYHMDQRMVADYPIINWLTTPAENHNMKYPMAGDTSHQVKLRIFYPQTKQTVELQTEGPKDQYLTCITWSPDEKMIFVAILNRDQNHLWLNSYDAITGKKIATLFEEKSDKYVEPQHPLAFLPGSNTEFLWWSQRDGYMHLYRYNTSGKLLNQVTKGPWVVNELVEFNKSAKEILITSSKESAMEKHGYAVNWETGSMSRLDNASGIHSLQSTDDGRYIVDLYSNATSPKGILLKSATDGFSKKILDAPDPLKDFARATVESITLKADDGTPLFAKMILPPDFDKNKKYPVIVYLYNGPHVQLIRNTFPASGNLWYEYMAQRGYIVFTMDGRGSSNRGLAFEDATFRKLGTVEMADQMQGVKYLQSQPFVDGSRMGMHGWSFGGFMTTSFMLRQPDVFKVGVAGGPVMDWSMYEIMYTERYMDQPQTNEKGYAEASLLTKVDQLKGKLLLIHGTDDDVVVWQHSLKFIKNCVDKGVQLDYFVYPGHQHNVRGKDRVHLMQKITDYFDLYLK